jgi:hypothetical protein
MRNQEMKILLLMDTERKLNEAHNQALRIDTVKAVARSPARLCMGRAGVSNGPQQRAE